MGMLEFAAGHLYFTGVMVLLNSVLAFVAAEKACNLLDRNLSEAATDRFWKKSLYKKCLDVVKQSLYDYERKGKKKALYLQVKEKMKRSGYNGEYAAAFFLSFKYLVPLIFFLAVSAADPSGIVKYLCVSVMMSVIAEGVLKAGRKKHNLVFQRYIYKIYKYLHNQISSGVRAADAVKTVYEVIEDKNLKDILVKLAASYELTLDIDLALNEFGSNFDADEADTLCVALKQGIMTGDNQEILAHQEEVMFKKYFNHIQAETDSCRTRSVISVAMFTAIIVIMIAVPLLSDVTDAVGRIFVN